MCSAPVLEVASLRERHPLFGDLLLSRYAPVLIYRLSINPEPPSPIEVERALVVDLIRSPGGPPEEVHRAIRWEGGSEFVQIATTLDRCLPERVANEDAAIGVMALLVSDLAGGVLQEVLEIGTSADYIVKLTSDGSLLPVEVSGICIARWPSDSHDRLAKKTTQILTSNSEGYVSVTTFKYPPDSTVHSYLHYVKKQTGPQSNKKRGRIQGRGASMSTESAQKPNQSSAATAAALEGGTALLRGDTNLARRKYVEAGELLYKRSKMAVKQQDRHLAWFLAATQFFKGGDYKRASQVASRIEAKFLPPHLRESLDAFVRQVRFRASDHYVQQIRRNMFELWRSKRALELLRLLQEHPYVQDPDGLAFLRAGLCERLGDFRAAASFFGAAYRFRPRIEYATIAAGSLFQLAGENRFKDAQDYAKFLTAELPHPVVLAAASAVWLQSARVTPPEERQHFFDTQLSLFERSRIGFLALPPGEMANPEVREIMLLAYESAPHALIMQGNEQGAAKIIDEALSRWPEVGDLWTTRGVAARGAQEGEPYFQRALELGAGGYVPYYFMALASLERGEYEKAIKWGREAIKQSTPEHQGAARLHAFLAVCIAESGGDRAEAERLFQRSLELDPNDKEVNETYRIFRDLGQSTPAPRPWPPRVQMTDWSVPQYFGNGAARIDREMGRVLDLAASG